MLILYTIYVDDLRFNFNHYKYISRIPSAMKYSLLFAYESIAQNALLQMTLPNNSQGNGYDHYSSLTYNTLSDMQDNFENGFDGAFSTYLADYNKEYYGDLCKSTIPNIVCAATTILSKGAKTAIYSLLSDTSQLIITYKNYGAGVTLAQRKQLIQSVYMTQAEEIFANVAVVLDDLVAVYRKDLDKHTSYGLLIGLIMI